MIDQSKNLSTFITGFPPQAFGHHIVIDSGKIIDNCISIFDLDSNPLIFVIVDDARKIFVGISLGRTKYLSN